MGHDLKLAVCLLFGALAICVVSMLISHNSWVAALDVSMAENAALEEVIATQAAEGDMLVRRIGQMAEHGFCEEAFDGRFSPDSGLHIELSYRRADRTMDKALVGRTVGED